MEHPMESGLYLINGATYLYIQQGTAKFDYTLYDKETMRQIYHGQLDVNAVWDQSVLGVLPAARSTVFDDYGINAVTVEAVPINMLRGLKSAQFSSPLDEYPRPDYIRTMTDIACMGYLKGDLLPVSDNIARDLFRKGFAIYAVNAHGVVHGPMGEDTIQASHINSIFAVSRAGWQNSQIFQNAVADRMNHQEEREFVFRHYTGDCFAIYQINRQNPDTHNILGQSLEHLQKQDQWPQRDNYELVYTAPLPEGTGLNALWKQFNTDHPPDYQHPNMSVSDVVAVKKNGTLTCYYVDQSSYNVLDDFLERQPLQKDKSKPSIRKQLAVAKSVQAEKSVIQHKQKDKGER